MSRTKFYNETTVDTTVEIDFLDHNLSKFSPRYKTTKYRVNETDLQRPDLISYRVYGTVNYWWIVLVFNGIQNPFTEIEVGDIINLPNILDIYDFYKKYTVR
jgi:hypothetical protein